MNEVHIHLHRQQAKAFYSKATEMLYGGAAGGGKSFLARAAASIWCAEIPGLQVFLFRRLSDDLYTNHMTGTGGFPDMLAPWMEAGKVKWRGDKNVLQFWNGSCIFLRHCQYEKDLAKYQGAEIHVLLLEEGTQFTAEMYRYLRGRCRLGGLKLPDKYKGAFPRIVITANPGGVGHSFFKTEFIDLQPPYKVMRMPKAEGGMLRQFIPAKLADNPTLTESDPDYDAKLMSLGNPTLVKAMLEGDWNIVAGGALDDLWESTVHVIPRGRVPKAWPVFRSFDWGSTHPYSVGWFARANGEEIYLADGTAFCPPKGSLVRIHEMYGGKDLTTNEGTKVPPTEIAQRIVLEESKLLKAGWIEAPVRPGPADSQIFNINDRDTESIAVRMSKEGVKFVAANKSSGSRINGLQLLRDRMANSIRGEGRAIYFMEHCRAAISTLPVLPRDQYDTEDVDTKSIDHVYDDVRYMCLFEEQAVPMNLKIEYPT